MALTNYELQKRHRQKYRTRAIAHLGGRCARCESTEGLEFDHVDRTTRVMDISAAIMAGWSWARLLEELAKCQLLCRPHHVEKSLEVGDMLSVEHGGGASGKKNCPCGPCKSRKAEYMRNYKRR